MTLIQLLTSQLGDLFRIGLLIALIYTTLQNRTQTGLWLPLAAGAVFVAVILPSTMGLGAAEALGFWRVVAVGLVANAIILTIAMAAWALYQRTRS